MDTDQVRNLSRTSGSVEAARETVSSAATNVSVLLADQPFREALTAELKEMADRLQKIDEELHLLAFNPSGPDCELRAYRLGHLGREPEPTADAEQLAAIDARRVA